MPQYSSRPRHRRSLRKAPLTDSTVPQLPRRKLQSPFQPLTPLSEDQLEYIHRQSLTILAELGIEVAGSQAIALFTQAGADVTVIDKQNALVRMNAELVMSLVSQAPANFKLNACNPDNSIDIGGNNIHFGMVSGTPNVHDAINGRRAGNIVDYQRFIKLGQYFNVINLFGNQTLAPTDLPANNRHLDTTFINLIFADKPFYSQGIGAGRVRDAISLTALAMGIELANLDDQIISMTNININSPRKLDDAMAYGAMQMAMHGQATTVTPFTLMGAMTPVTMAAALAQQNSEALFGICLIQLTKPGAPVVYGGFTANVDMKTGSPAFGTPENALANIAGGQLARKYQLPYRSSACNAANTVDAQATYETQMALWGAVMGHANIVYHAAGWLEGGLVASFEKLVIDCEMLQGMSELLQPIQVSDAELGIDAMKEVGPGGHFFGCDHTMQRYQNAFYRPFLSDWQNQENWQKHGSLNATQRATKIWQQALADYQQPTLDQAHKEAMEAYITKRKEQLGAKEPELEPEYMI